jgi:hypothetical protein
MGECDLDLSIVAGLQYIGETPEYIACPLRSSTPELLVLLAQWSNAVVCL